MAISTDGAEGTKKMAAEVPGIVVYSDPKATIARKLGMVDSKAMTAPGVTGPVYGPGQMIVDGQGRILGDQRAQNMMIRRSPAEALLAISAAKL